MRRALFGAIASAGLLPALLDFAMAEEKDFIFNGTGIHALLDQDQGVAIFSNGCGTQTLTLQQLQAGETPSNILPCSTSGGTTAPGPDNPEPCRAGQSEIQCKCSQRADALGLHGEARWTFRANCKAEMRAGLSPDSDGWAK